jgi:hypothetical protein
MRELVENGLDASEAHSILPELTVEMYHVHHFPDAARIDVGKTGFQKMVGISDSDRVDLELYEDFKSKKKPKVIAPGLA